MKTILLTLLAGFCLSSYSQTTNTAGISGITTNKQPRLAAAAAPVNLGLEQYRNITNRIAQVQARINKLNADDTEARHLMELKRDAGKVSSAGYVNLLNAQSAAHLKAIGPLHKQMAELKLSEYQLMKTYKISAPPQSAASAGKR